MTNFSPFQVIVGGCLLAFGASFLNAGFILSTGVSVSHLTGDVARLGSGIPTNEDFSDFNGWGKVAIAGIGFVIGAMASGYFLHHPSLEIRLPYGRILSILGLLLLCSHWLYAELPCAAVGVASLVCGFQNALASRYRGMVLRTTHLTGLLTDAGLYLGMKIRGNAVEGWKIAVPICIALSFLFGAVLGGVVVLQGRGDWILLSSVGYLIGGILWSINKRYLLNVKK